ncbi:hypothetical protein FRC18_010057 [Serendipita sp. 400]|nr:hypothetical protein FRC18_010057 [Serendipita sp. 400]
MPRNSFHLVSLWPSKPRVVASKRDERLPPELWSIIIDFILDEIRQPYQYCSPEKFPRYQARLSEADHLEEDSDLEGWRNIRSVCRTWRRLAGPRPHVNVMRVHADLSTGESTFKGASSMLFHKQVDEQLIFGTLVRNPALTSHLTTIIFSEDRHWHGIDALLDNPSSFPRLRCLSLLSTRSRRPFWRRLEEGYPQLVSLTIRQYVCGDEGQYTLENLEILDISSWRDLELSCPSLKHLSIRQACTDTVIEFLMKHGDQLESLLLDDNALFRLLLRSEQFWTMFPNIQTLGKQAGGKAPPIPPPNHPLRHLRLLSHPKLLTISMILKDLDWFSGVTHLHVRPVDLHTDTMEQLRARCMERKVKVVEVPNLKLVSTPRLGSIVASMVLAVTCPCWLPILVCSLPFMRRTGRR